MPEENPLLNFYLELEGDVTDRANPQSGDFADFREAAFTEILAADLEEAGVLESPVTCHYESGRAAASIKANGYAVPDEDSRLDLIITIYEPPGDAPSTLNAATVETAFNQLERYLTRSFDGLHEQLDPAKDEYAMASRLHELKGKIDRVNFLLFTNCRLAQRREKTRKDSVSGLKATFQVWDIERLRRLRESNTTFEALSVDLQQLPGGGLPCTRLPGAPDGFSICVTIFPGTLLADLYDEHGARLLELNVRSYLQARGKVNAGILETLRNKPEDFMAYNNGITVVAEEIQFGRLKNGADGILALKGMQIVNGGQTTASIHRAAKEYEANLTRVFVQGKVTVVPPARFDEVVPLISRFSNSQNKVSESDLSANHAFHIGIGRVASREWTPDQKTKWFYERARGSYQTAKNREGITEAKRRDFETKFPPHQRFTKEDLAKFENAWRGQPHIVSRGGQKCFTHFMVSVTNDYGKLPDSWEPSAEDFRRLVAKGILFREVQRIVKADVSITAYRIDVTAYTVALLADKTARRIDLDAIWRQQAISPALAATAKAWAPVVFVNLPKLAEREGRHLGESFKSQACWDYIRSLHFEVPPALERELTTSALNDRPTGTWGNSGRAPALRPADHNNVARCMELSETQWLAIAKWGQEAGQLASWQRGIARTLAAYAAEGWSKPPSQKQAKHGADIIEIARSAGIL